MLQTVPVPAHIPKALVLDFDYLAALTAIDEPHKECAHYLRENAGNLFYTPRNGGHWIVQGAELTVQMFRDTELFSSEPQYNPTRAFEPLLLPTQADPPSHGQYRKAIGTMFSPASMRRIEPEIRQIARDLIDRIEPRGGCEFVAEFGDHFPIVIFLKLVGAPMSDRDELLRYAAMFTRSAELAVRSQGTSSLAAYIRNLNAERRRNPGDDMLSHIVNGTFEGRPLSDQELEGIGVLLFLAGLDTVKSALAFIMLYLAQHPDQYAKLVADKDVIPTAVEELLRISGPAIPERGVTRDVEFEGVELKQGERIVFLLPVMGFDEHLNQDAYKVDLQREISQHIVFGAGAHRCAGSHLARIEVRVLLEEWTQRFPTFRLDPNRPPSMTAGGPVWAPAEVPLLWP